MSSWGLGEAAVGFCEPVDHSSVTGKRSGGGCNEFLGEKWGPRLGSLCSGERSLHNGRLGTAEGVCTRSGKGLLRVKGTRKLRMRDRKWANTVGEAEDQANAVSPWVSSWTSWHGPWGLHSVEESQGTSGWERVKSSSVDSFLENFASWTKDRWNKCELMQFLLFKGIVLWSHDISCT